MHWLHRHRLSIVAGICFFFTVIVLGLHFVPGIPFFSTVWRSEQGFEDLLRREGRKTPTHQDFVFLGIDQSTLSFQPFDPEDVKNNRAFELMTAHSFPWSRELWAVLLDRLFQSGARLVIFDIMFDKPGEGDAEFHAALDRYRDKVVIGSNFDFSNVQTTAGVAVKVPPNKSLIPPPQLEDDRVGYVVFFPDVLDQKIRSARYTMTDLQLARQPPEPSETPYESLSARAATKLGRADAIPRDLRPHLIRFSEPFVYPPHPLWEVFDPAMWRANYAEGKFFKDKIVMIGSSAQIVHDVFDTPISPETPGPVIHLHALAAALDHQFLYDTPIGLDFATICFFALLAFGVLALVRRALLNLGALTLISGSYLGISRFLYDHWGILIMVVPALTVFLLSGVVGLAFEYTLERLEKLRTRRTLERYVSKNLVKEILENPGGFYSSLLGARKPVTVLFSDLVGFTSLSEKADPAALVQQLNRYLSCMVPMVFDNGGTLDKFIGDAIMAVWGNVSSHGVASDCKAAVRAALGMRFEMRKLNEAWKSEGVNQLAFGVGINQGEALIGNIGSYAPHERLDPTVIGDSVNLASRLEGLTRVYSVDILLGPTVAEYVRDEFHLRSVARAQVKGKTEPVDIFTLVGAHNGDVDPELINWLKTYEEGLTHFRTRSFTQAKILLSRFLEFYPDDFLAKMYLDRALDYE
ncbi:MAG: adenylate/guanylate cyclase domain-containing protein, partial [Verrucomicrobiota bacterium]